MTKFNEILVGRYNRALQKFLGMKGEAPAPQISTEFIPVFPFFFGIENRYLESWDRFSFTLVLAAPGAGNTNNVRFRNPIGSNVIAVIEKMLVGSTAADTIGVQQGATNTDLGTPQAQNIGIDPRGRLRTTLIPSSSSTGAPTALTIGYADAIVNNSMIELVQTDDQEFPLLPGQAIQWLNGGPNLQLTIGAILWRERFLEESERF